MISRTPKVSIIIPVFNGHDYLRSSIDSALNQTYNNTEVIVVNDGSNDGGKTEKVARSYGDKIRYFYKKNGGVASALNLGIREMSGRYFSWLSHDDVYYPDKISNQVSRILRESKRTIIYSDYEIIDEKSNFVRIVRLKTYRKGEFLFSLLMNRYMNGCTLLIPKTAFREAGSFNEELLTTQDYDMWFRLLRIGYNFIHIPEVTLKSRVHGSQGSKTKAKQLLNDKNILFTFILQHYPPELICPSKNGRSYRYLTLSINYKKEGLKEAYKYARRRGIGFLLNCNGIVNFSKCLYLIFYSLVRYNKYYYVALLKKLIRWSD